jgi:deoxyxylulose-5-phosphate synthase
MCCLLSIALAWLEKMVRTHAGSYDLTYLRCIPNMIVMAPSDEDETHKLLSTGYHHKGPAAVRYPRGKGPGTEIERNLDPCAYRSCHQSPQGSFRWQFSPLEVW